MDIRGFKEGDLVWAKMKYYPFWPAKIAKHPNPYKLRKQHSFVCFYGTRQYAWVLDDNIVFHDDDALRRYGKDSIRYKGFQNAVKGIVKASKLKRTVSDDCESKITIFNDEESSQSLELERERNVLKLSNIAATQRQIGFLGLGKIGEVLAMNLILSGHSVTVWNRTGEKCKKFVELGATKEPTPAHVILACDVTFCCMSDPEVSRHIVFKRSGVLDGLLEHKKSGKGFKKGYVELTTLDPVTSEVIHNAVSLNGGSYLEAPLHGSRFDAIKSELLVIASGDRDTFNECSSCFDAMGKKSLFISEEVQTATMLNLVNTLLTGTVYSAAAESLALVDRLNLEGSLFLSIVNFGDLIGSKLLQEVYSMIEAENKQSVIPSLMPVFAIELAKSF